jgi:hypothetical protein
MSRAFYEQYCAETLVYVSHEMLVNGVSREGLDADALNADLAALRP